MPLPPLLPRQELESGGLRMAGAPAPSSFGLVVVDPGDDPKFEDFFMSVHATLHTFAETGATKIVENHLRRAYIQFLPPPVASPATQAP